MHLHVGRSVHPVYREQLHALPPGFRYRYVHPNLNDASAGTRLIVEQGARFAGERAAVKRVAAARPGQRRLRAPLDARGSTTTWTSSTAPSSSCAPRKPYVVDFEQVGTFALWQPRAFDRPWARDRLRRMIEDEHCKHLLPWSDAARDGLLNVVGDRVAAR